MNTGRLKVWYSGVWYSDGHCICLFQLAKLHESVVDIWSRDDTNALLREVHQRFVASVKAEIRQRKILDPESPQARLLLSELTFYGQSLLRLNAVPEEMLKRETFEEIWQTL